MVACAETLTAERKGKKLCARCALGVADRGYRYDAETGNYYVRNRYYSPTLGRWLARDPIGYQGGANLYEYLDSGPATGADALGLITTGEIRYVLGQLQLDLGHATAAGRGVRRIQKAVTYFEALGGNPLASRKVTQGLVDSLLGKARDLVAGDGGGLVGPIFDADLGEIKIALLAKGAVDALGQESVPCRVCAESDVATPHPNGSVWTTSFRESHTIHFLYLIPLETIPWQVSCKKADCQLYALA